MLRTELDRVLSGFPDEKAAEFAEFSDAAVVLSLGMARDGRHDTAELYAAAASLELFHTFGLIHDDVMDDSHARRGRPTVHHQLTHRHHTAGWSGDPARFGASVAILCGDLLTAWSDELQPRNGIT